MSRFGKGFMDQDPPAKYPERHIRVFVDPMSDEPRICVFTMNNGRDVFRGVSLSLDDAEKMAGLILELIAKSSLAPASAQAEQPTEAQP